MATKGDKTISSFSLGDDTFKAGDMVAMRPPETSAPAFIAKIDKIVDSPVEGIMVRAMWYYRPEEAQGGRKAFHGERELFSSDHMDWCSGGAITQRVRVRGFADFQSLEEVGELDYYCRMEYRARDAKFRPERLPVYCLCEMPFNPDTPMVQCVCCEDFYHPSCIGTTEGEANSQKHFVCSMCIKERRERMQTR